MERKNNCRKRELEKRKNNHVPIFFTQRGVFHQSISYIVLCFHQPRVNQKVVISPWATLEMAIPVQMPVVAQLLARNNTRGIRRTKTEIEVMTIGDKVSPAPFIARDRTMDKAMKKKVEEIKRM